MIVKELRERLQGLPDSREINWQVNYRKLEEPIEFSVFDEKLHINFDSIEVDYDSCYDYYDECPDCGRDLN